MPSKTVPCTSKNSRHKWTFVKNVTLSRETLTHISLTAAGKYKCDHCGKVKYGFARFQRDELHAA